MDREKAHATLFKVAFGAAIIGCTASTPPPAMPSSSADKTTTTEKTSGISDGAPWIGGQTTTEIAAPSFAILDFLCRPEAIWHILPRVDSVESLGQDGNDTLMRISHKLGIFRGGYVVRIRPSIENDGRASITVRVDERYDRDVDKASALFVLEPNGTNSTRLHYHVQAMLYPGLIRWLFSGKFQWALMFVPDRIRAHIERQYSPHPP